MEPKTKGEPETKCEDCGKEITDDDVIWAMERRGDFGSEDVAVGYECRHCGLEWEF